MIIFLDYFLNICVACSLNSSRLTLEFVIIFYGHCMFTKTAGLHAVLSVLRKSLSLFGHKHTRVCVCVIYAPVFRLIRVLCALQ